MRRSAERDTGASAADSANHPWWRNATFYQIYLRSFADANGDGVGDLEGVRSRLGYLELLGVDALWLTPFYPSPMADGGYDVADPRAVDPLFGDLIGFDTLVADAHARGIKVTIDLVPNHTS
ncbi:MAG: alpha-amylase family glycosyl hydrolase, partial [Sciscionella sp.]